MRSFWQTKLRWGLTAACAVLMAPAFSQYLPVNDSRPATCPAWPDVRHSANRALQFDQVWNRARLSCGISVTRNVENGAVDEKLFQFYDDGLILVFTPLPGRVDLASRGYYLFPVRARRLTFEMVNDDLRVTLPTGGTLTFLGRNGALEPGPSLRSTSNEVFEVFGDGVLLDLGEFTPAPGRSGDLPHRHRMGTNSWFVDPAGVRCPMVNSAIFDYERRESPILRSSLLEDESSFQALPDGPIRALLMPCEAEFGFNRTVIPVPWRL